MSKSFIEMDSRERGKVAENMFIIVLCTLVVVSVGTLIGVGIYEALSASVPITLAVTGGIGVFLTVVYKVAKRSV